METVFVVLSHTLTPEQIADLGDARIILLSDVAPNLAAQCRSVSAKSSLEEVQELAARVVAIARKKDATYFVCQGEPCLAMWANMLAYGVHYHYDGCNQLRSDKAQKIMLDSLEYDNGPLVCLQSTTERVSVETTNPETGEVVKTSTFKHVQWRSMF